MVDRKDSARKTDTSKSVECEEAEGHREENMERKNEMASKREENMQAGEY